MKSVCVITLICIVLTGATMATAQQPSELDKLRAEIRKLETFERDPTVPPDVRALNDKFLQQRRTRLRSLIADEIKALQTYERSAGSVLNNEERSTVQASIAALQKELDTLNAATASASSNSDASPSTARGPTNGDGGSNGAATDRVDNTGNATRGTSSNSSSILSAASVPTSSPTSP